MKSFRFTQILFFMLSIVFIWGCEKTNDVYTRSGKAINFFTKMPEGNVQVCNENAIECGVSDEQGNYILNFESNEYLFGNVANRDSWVGWRLSAAAAFG